LAHSYVKPQTLPHTTARSIEHIYNTPTSSDPLSPPHLLIAVLIDLFPTAHGPAHTCFLPSPYQLQGIPPLYPSAHTVATASPSAMATVVASHNIGLWQDRREPSMHIPNMHLNNIMPPYDTSRNVSNAPVSREYQPTSNHMDMNNMPLYSANTLPTSVPYQAGAYAYDVPTSVPVNPYNMQQASYYASNMPHPVSYPQSHDIQALPTLPDVRHVFNPNVKSEGTSPAQSNHMYADPSYGTELKRSTSEPTEGSGANFATDVDTLMRAIQAKQTNPPPENEQKVCYSLRDFKFDLLMFRRTTHQRMPRSLGSVISALCPTATRASTRRHTLRSTYAPILVTSHFLAKHLDVASPSRSSVTSRHMKGVTPESDHTAATSVARHSPNVATFAHTRLFTNRSSPSAAS
jgi:hypothetical protein